MSYAKRKLITIFITLTMRCLQTSFQSVAPLGVGNATLLTQLDVHRNTSASMSSSVFK